MVQYARVQTNVANPLLLISTHSKRGEWISWESTTHTPKLPRRTLLKSNTHGFEMSAHSSVGVKDAL